MWFQSPLSWLQIYGDSDAQSKCVLDNTVHLEKKLCFIPGKSQMLEAIFFFFLLNKDTLSVVTWTDKISRELRMS